MNAPAERRVAFIGDVHLEPGDPALEPFCAMLQRVAARCDRIVLMGDLFTVWIGQPGLQQPHQLRVVETLRALRTGGTRVDYVEGNRDYRIGALCRGDAFDRVGSGGFEYVAGGRRVAAIHGDLVNAADRLFRVWRTLSRTRLVWAIFSLLPPRMRLRLASWAEARLRGVNLRFKGAFPEPLVREYARPFLRAGNEALVLGHFHVERRLETEDPAGTVVVLPEWKGSRRHLEVDERGLTFHEEPVDDTLRL